MGVPVLEDQIEMRVHLSTLFDIYDPVLTRKQSEAFRLHFLNDLSLSEVADRLEVTRQGAHDLVQRGKERLLEMESLLGFARKESEWNIRLQEIRSWSDDFGGDIPQEALTSLEEIIGTEIHGREAI
jgi:hypothetical protein